jgi:ABC-type uncharacterized transport system ATPase subunit
LRTNALEELIRDYKAILENKRPLPSGKYYRECNELEKNRLDTLLDIARMMQRTSVRGKTLSDGEKDFLVFTLFESTLLNMDVHAWLTDTEKERQFEEAGKFLKKVESVLGEEYVEERMRQFEFLKRRIRFDRNRNGPIKRQVISL